MAKVQRWLWALALGVCLLVSPGQAQSPLEATLSPPDTSAFPHMETFLSVSRAPGKFWPGLHAGQVRILENGQSLPVETLEELRPGMQLALAINPGPSFAIRDAQGMSRYDYLAAILKRWAQNRRGSTLDDLSLLVGGEVSRTHLNDPAELASLLAETPVDARQANPNLDVLSLALDVASDPTARPGMKRAILLVTAPLEGDISFGLENFVARASQQQVRVFVWVVAAPGTEDIPSVAQLRQMALDTGGEAFFFSGEAMPPSPEVYFNGLRSIYRLRYQSAIQQGGSQTLQAVIEAEGARVESEPVQFELSLLPPDPALLSPIVELTRRLPAGALLQEESEPLGNQLEPSSQPLKILVDFPDGKPRPLAFTRLYVDGELVAENTAPPYDQFLWTLAPYTSTNQHILQIEAQDHLGLTARSIETPVDIIVELPAPNSWRAILRNGPVLAAALLGIALLGVLLFLVVTGRIRPHSLRGSWNLIRVGSHPRSNKNGEQAPKKSRRTLVPQPARRISGWVSRIHWPQRRMKVKANAYFIPLVDSESGTSENPIPVTADEITFGQDKNLATITFADLSVNALHARLLNKAEQEYWILDEGSIAGTWVNYELVPPEGTRLEHGDLVHLGRVGLRFQQRPTQPDRKPVIYYQRWQL